VLVISFSVFGLPAVLVLLIAHVRLAR